MHKLVFLRHGESVWNKEKLFTGWTDVDLSEKGVEEAHKAGKILKENDFVFDLALTSVLIRATKTLDIVLEELGQNIPVEKSWRLNERFYGDLQGKNKHEMVERVGEKQVNLWRRSYDVAPPSIKKTDKRYPGNDPKYKDLKEDELPITESLKDVLKRVLPYWEEKIAPEIEKGKRIIISAHGNSLRPLIMHIDNLSKEEVFELNIPTGLPLIYELDENLNPIRHYYLGNPEEIKKAIEKVENQIK